MKKVAIFVDWENVRKGIFEKAATALSKKVNYNDVDNTLKFFKAFVDPKEEEVFRVFVYLSEPYAGMADGTDCSKSAVFASATKFIENMQVKDLVALRKGKTVYRGLDKNSKPIFMQKQVDMLLGLDIAHVSYNRLADRILILTLDTDVIPAMKTARTNGLQVIWGYCPDIQTELPTGLKKHSDFVRGMNFKTIFP